MKTQLTAFIALFFCGSILATNPNDTDHYLDFETSFIQPVYITSQPETGSLSAEIEALEEVTQNQEQNKKRFNKDRPSLEYKF